MKPHFEVKFRRGAPSPDAPYWEDVIHERTVSEVSIDREIARLLERYALPVIVTRAYAPQGATWSDEEIAAGLDRVYRLVLREDRAIPEGLLRDISLVPVVEYARPGRIGHAELPQPEVAQLSVTTDERSRDAIYLEQAQQYSLGDPSVIVAVLDTGVWLHHPEFDGRLLPGRDFVDILDGAGQFFGDYLDADDDPTDAV